MWLILFLRTQVYKGFIYEYQFACFVCACVDVRLCVKSEWSSYSLINSNLIKSQLGLSFMMLVAAKTLLKHVPNNQFIILFILRHKNNLFFSLSLSRTFSALLYVSNFSLLTEPIVWGKRLVIEIPQHEIRFLMVRLINAFEQGNIKSLDFYPRCISLFIFSHKPPTRQLVYWNPKRSSFNERTSFLWPPASF